MVARVRNLTSSSSTAEYFHEEGGYYTAARGDREAARAKAAEHRQASAWYGKGAAALGLKAGQKVSASTFETILQGHVLGTDIRLGRKRDGKHEHRPGFDITFSAAWTPPTPDDSGLCPPCRCAPCRSGGEGGGSYCEDRDKPLNEDRQCPYLVQFGPRETR